MPYSNILQDTSAKNIAQHIASLPKTNSGKDRIVVITQGAQETVVAIGTKSVTSYPVTPLAKDAIVDTNGAGDATAGGFVAAFVLGSPIPECVEVGHKLGAMCIQQNGPQLPYPKQKVLQIGYQLKNQMYYVQPSFYTLSYIAYIDLQMRTWYLV